MQTTRVIRNCLPVFRLVCPQRWEALAPTEESGVRHCGPCDQRVYLCSTDEETIAHARAGHCIAREMPDASELPRVYVGRPVSVQPVTPQEDEALRVVRRERGVDDAIRNARRSSRSCPRCAYAAPDWRVECRVCGFEMGRALPAGELGGPKTRPTHHLSGDAFGGPLNSSVTCFRMPSPIHHMTVVRYYRDRRPYDCEDVRSPSWSDVEAAIRRMDNYCFPIVQLNCTEHDDDENIFNVIGGAGRFAVFHMMGEWQYEDPDGKDSDVRLWDSDQGYFCKERNVLTDIDKVLRITKAFYESGSYDQLDEVE